MVQLDPTTTSGGIYAKVAGKTVNISGTAISNILGIGMAATIAVIAKQTADTQQSFEQTILPLLESQRQAADRASGMGITGWTTGANAGELATNFLEQYAEMTEAERMFWGQITAAKSKPDFNMFGFTDLGVLEGALRGYSMESLSMGKGMMDMPPGPDSFAKEKMTDEEILADAMVKGIEESPLARLVDYIIMSGDTESDIAKLFYKQYGGYMDTVIKPAYGVDTEWLGAVSAILDSGNQEVKDFIVRNNLTGMTADQIPLSMKSTFDQIIQASQDSLESMILPVLQAQAQYNSAASSPLADDYKRVVMGADFSGMSDEAIKQLGEVLGITLQNVAGGGVIGIDSEKIADNIMGWVTRLPDTISLDGASLSAQDVAILASAGIQINGDGTVTFMKAMNENVTVLTAHGLTIDDVRRVIEKLKGAGLSFSVGDVKLTKS